MSLALQYAGLRIYKARVRRPAWQDNAPKTQSGKDTYRIAAKHAPDFSRAFRAAVRAMLPEDMPKPFREAVDTQSSVDAYKAVEDTIAEGLEKFEAALLREYEKVINESGDATYRDLNKQLGTNLGFEIAKGKKQIPRPMSPHVRAASRAMLVPVNPYSKAWMKTQSTKLIKYVREKQAQTIQNVLSAGFEKGLRPELVYDDIKANIGLTPRDAGAVARRKELLTEQGYSRAETAALAARYRDQLLDLRAEMIGRTETISAQAQGRLDAWKVAEESGQLKGVVREWVSAPPGPPGRPCERCLLMNGKQAEVGGSYESDEGPVERPGLHQMCRCTEILVRV